MYGCSNYDKLFSTGGKCFSVDFGRDHGADHVYPGKSFPCCFSRTLYVRGCSKLFRAYQKFLITLLFCLSFCFPTFAEDENYQFQNIGYEAMANQGMDVNQYLIDQYQEERHAEIADILAEPLANPYIRSISADANSISFTSDRVSDTLFHYTALYHGTYDISNFRYFVLESRNNNNWVSNLIPIDYTWQDIYSGYFDISDIPSAANNIRALYVFNQPNANPLYFGPSVNLSDLNNEPITADIWSFFHIVNDCFTWILDHIGEFITFILGNAFLSVSLLLFMCGAVISFYVRIRRS